MRKISPEREFILQCVVSCMKIRMHGGTAAMLIRQLLKERNINVEFNSYIYNSYVTQIRNKTPILKDLDRRNGYYDYRLIEQFKLRLDSFKDEAYFYTHDYDTDSLIENKIRVNKVQAEF